MIIVFNLNNSLLEGQSTLVIYLDLIIMLNVVFNFFLLLLTKYVARETIPWFRLFLGTVIATLLVPLVIYFPNTFIQSLLGKVIYSILIIVVTFGIKSVQQVVANLFIFYFISFTVGGGLIGIQYLTTQSTSISNYNFLLYVNNMYGNQVSLVLLFIGFPLVLYFTKSRLDMHAKEKIKYDQLYEVTIEMNSKNLRTRGFIDSGNHLTDPFTNRPVVICDEILLKQFFDEQDWNLIRKAITEESFEQIPHRFKKLISIVPYQGVEGKSSYMFTMRPDKLVIIYENQLIESRNVLIGIQLANLTVDHRYHCLLHPHIIQFGTVRTA